MESQSSLSSPSGKLYTPPLRFQKVGIITREGSLQEKKTSLTAEQPDSLHVDSSQFFCYESVHGTEGLSDSPKYFSTPKLEHLERRRFVRYNSQPARRISFTQSIEGEESRLTFAQHTPVLDFTKLKDATTPDSGFCTPARSERFDSLSSSPILPLASRSSSPDGYGSANIASTPFAVSSPFLKVKAIPSSSAQGDYSSGAAAINSPSKESRLDKSLDLPTWVSSFCHSEISTATTCVSTSNARSQTKQRVSSFKPKQSISRGQPANHPGLVNMPQLTPIPVIMAPTLPRLTSALQLRDASRVSAATKCCSKRKALEELEPNTLNKPESEDEPERPNHSYMDLIKMALESAPDGQMTLKEIVSWIEDHFAYFRVKAKQTWKNSIRHNLSLHHDFAKVEEKRHGGKWKLAEDAKKYAHRIPKPPVVKPPPKPAPIVCAKRKKSGLQPILPKTVPYALVPIALAPFGPSGTTQDSLTEENLGVGWSSQQHQAQLLGPATYIGQNSQEQEEQQQEMQASHLDQQEPPQGACNAEALLQQQQQQCCLTQPHEDENAQHQMQTVMPANEVKLHFRLTQEHKQQLRLEQTRQQRRSLLGPAKSETWGKGRNSEGYPGAKFQPSHPIIPKFPARYMSDNTKYSGLRSAPMKLPLLAPKPNSDIHSTSNHDLQFTSLKTICKPGKQSSSKSRDICRFLDRLPKSKSFDCASKTKLPKNFTKKLPKQKKPKGGPVLNLASMVREDMQAAEEINRILREGDENMSESVHKGKAQMQSLSHFSGILEQRDLNRPGSEPGNDLLQQVYEQTISPLAWDEDSLGSILSSGVEDGATLITDTAQMHVDLPFPNTQNDSSSTSTAGSQIVFRSFSSISNKTVSKSSHRTSEDYSSTSEALQVTPAIPQCTVENSQGQQAVSTTQSPSTISQLKPRFYRTKSRRKQVHVPLNIDLSPKRESKILKQSDHPVSPGKVAYVDNKEIRREGLKPLSIFSSDVSLSAPRGNSHTDHSNVSGGLNLFNSDTTFEHVMVEYESERQPVPVSNPTKLSVLESDCAYVKQSISGLSPESCAAKMSSTRSIFTHDPGQPTSPSNEALDLSPSTRTYSRPSSLKAPGFDDIGHKMAKKSLLSSAQDTIPTFMSKYSISRHFEASMSSPSVESIVPGTISSGFAGSSSVPFQPASDHQSLSPSIEHTDWRGLYDNDKSGYGVAARADMTDPTNTLMVRAPPYLLSLPHTHSPSMVTSDRLEQSIPSGVNHFSPQSASRPRDDVFQQSYQEASFTQQTHSFSQGPFHSQEHFLRPMPSASQVTTEADTSYSKLPFLEQVYLHSNTLVVTEPNHHNLYKNGLASNSDANGAAVLQLSVNDGSETNDLNHSLKAYLHNGSLAQNELNQHGLRANCPSHTYSAVTDFHQEQLTWVSETGRVLGSHPSTTITTPSTFSEHEDTGALEIVVEESPTFLQQNLTYLQQGHHESEGNPPTDSSNFYSENLPVSHDLERPSYGHGGGGYPSLSQASVVRYSDSKLVSPPPADSVDIPANDSSFLNSSVFDNIDSLMQTSLNEPGSPPS